MAKITYHIPTETYGFVEVEEMVLEDDNQLERYEDIKARVMPLNASTTGLNPLEWRTAYDGYKSSHTLSSEVYEKMNGYQQFAIQEEKKYYKRTNPDK